MQGEHLYTIHHTYNGNGCAHCGKPAKDHPPDEWMVNGEKVNRKEEKNATETA